MATYGTAGRQEPRPQLAGGRGATAGEARAILAAEYPVSNEWRDTARARQQRGRSTSKEEIRKLRTELRAAQALIRMLERENAALKLAGNQETSAVV